MTDSEEDNDYVAHCLDETRKLLTPTNIPDPEVLRELLRLREHTKAQFNIADEYIKDYEKDFKKEHNERQKLREENFLLKWDLSEYKSKAEAQSTKIVYRDIVRDDSDRCEEHHDELTILREKIILLENENTAQAKSLKWYKWKITDLNEVIDNLSDEISNMLGER